MDERFLIMCGTSSADMIGTVLGIQLQSNDLLIWESPLIFSVVRVKRTFAYDLCCARGRNVN